MYSSANLSLQQGKLQSDEIHSLISRPDLMIPGNQSGFKRISNGKICSIGTRRLFSAAICATFLASFLPLLQLLCLKVGPPA
jgi:hypothetical protein